MNATMKKGTAVGIILLLAGISFLALPSDAGQKAVEKKVNINTASSAELQTLPRIGPKVAQRIIDFRKKNGKFKRIEELMKIEGIGEKIFRGLRDRITVGDSSKVK